MTAVQAKVYFPNNQIRRLSFNTDSELLQIKNILKTSFELSPLFSSITEDYDFQLWYLDDEFDWILVNTEPEWTTALTITSNQDLMRIKVAIVRKKSVEVKRKPVRICPSVIRRHYGFPLIKILGQSKENPNSEESVPSTVSTDLNLGETAQTQPETQSEQTEPEKEVTSTSEPATLDRVDPIQESTVPQAPQSTVSEEPIFKYENELHLLETMGFNNAELNKHFVSHFEGDLRQVVSSLLSLQ